MPFSLQSRAFGRVLPAAILAIGPAAFLSTPALAREEPPPGAVARLQQEVDTLRAEIAALREQVAALVKGAPAQAAPGQPTPAPPQAPPETPPAEAAPAVPSSPEPLPPPASAEGGARSTSSVFNPNISAVFQFIGNSSFSHDLDEEGFSLSEAEISLQSVVDPYARVDLFLSFDADGEAAVEEGTVTSTSLPGGMQLKGGRFKSAFGLWNRWHPHQFPTVDQPDALEAWFGGEPLTSDGVSLAWLIPGTSSVFLESTTEVGNTGNEIAFNTEGSDPVLLEHLSSVFTLTSNATLGLGGSAAIGKAGPTEALLNAIEEAGLAGLVEPRPEADSRLFGLDASWKWRPLARKTRNSATVQAEAFLSHRDVDVLEAAALREETVKAWGGYLYGEYQFARRWRAGVRWDRTQFPDDEEALQRALSAVLRIVPSEFQEFRIQFKGTRRNEQAAVRFDDQDEDHEIFFEWIPAIGAHAAHAY
jgi:hypothetical protein